METYSAYVVTIDNPNLTTKENARARRRLVKRLRNAATVCVEFGVDVYSVAEILHDECEDGSSVIVIPHAVCPELA